VYHLERDREGGEDRQVMGPGILALSSLSYPVVGGRGGGCVSAFSAEQTMLYLMGMAAAPVATSLPPFSSSRSMHQYTNIMRNLDI